MQDFLTLYMQPKYNIISAGKHTLLPVIRPNAAGYFICKLQGIFHCMLT